MANEVLIILGTRPEAIKLLPLYLSCREAGIPALLCSTAQHTDLLQQVFDLFCITPDFNLNIMQKNQTLSFSTSIILEKVQTIINTVHPSLIIVQGDTTTAFASALAGFYNHIPIGHVEAGLRTYNMQAPFPEEFNRQGISKIANYHFAPTKSNALALEKESIPSSSIFITGNTVIDALSWVKKKLDDKSITARDDLYKNLEHCANNNQKVILLTAHRRESFGEGLKNIFEAIKHFAKNHQDVMIFYPLHPNPHVADTLQNVELDECNNIKIMQPLRYEDLVFLLYKCDFIISDSGGIQEEAVSIGKTVLILREITERNEGIEEGLAFLVGTKTKKILQALEREYSRARSCIKKSSAYGDGDACKKIVAILKKITHNRKEYCEIQVNT